ncbi:MAG: hypothetical protein ACLQBK_20615 [Candidatus Sulfotelmatobacter sp.]
MADVEGALDDAIRKVTPYLETTYEVRRQLYVARVVECQSKAGRSEQADNKLKNDVLPILQEQPGFVDFLTLSDKKDPERLGVHQFLDLARGCRGVSQAPL